MGGKPEEYARLLAGALCKLHAAERQSPSPLISEESIRVISETIAAAMEDARRALAERELAVLRESREPLHLHS